MNKQHFSQFFLSHKNTIKYIFDLLNCTSVDFFKLFGFWQVSLWLYASLLKKLHIIYQYGYQFFILLFGRILPGVIISHHLKIRSLGLEKNLHIGMFTVWESFFTNHKSESWISWHILIQHIFQTFCRHKKLQNTVSTKMFCICKIYC